MSKILSPQFPPFVSEFTPFGLFDVWDLTANLSKYQTAKKGYAPGCLLRFADATTVLGSIYVNIGTLTSSNFVPLSPAGGSTLGFIHLPLNTWRLVASNDVPAIAVASGNGGNLASDTAPKLIRVSTSTDKALTLTWAASSSIEIFNQFAYPPDLDITKSVVVNLTVKSGGSTDTPTIAVGVFDYIGDTNRGGNSAALSSAFQNLTVSYTPLAAYPSFANIQITPGAHTTDTVVIVDAWVNYTRKSLTS